jgi:hypothetical protein
VLSAEVAALAARARQLALADVERELERADVIGASHMAGRHVAFVDMNRRVARRAT